MTTDNPSNAREACEQLNESDTLAWFSPCCGDKTLPPAVNGHGSRFCRRCGHHFAPDLAVARLIRHTMYRDAQLAQGVL